MIRCCWFSLWLGLAITTPGAAYDYPFANPLTATVIGTPSQYQAPLPITLPREEYRVDGLVDRPTATIFWYAEELRYSLIPQPGPAPLAVVITGTGGGHDSATAAGLHEILWGGGFHVLALPSTTYLNFIVAASTSGIPGRLDEDAEDIYRALTAIWPTVQEELDITEVVITGYSLGAAQAAVVARLDQERGNFGFQRLLLINPPLSLYNSVQILDRMLEENIPASGDGIQRFLQQVMADLGRVFEREEALSLSEDFIYDIYRKLEPTDQELAAAIGFAFRFSVANMLFTADVVANRGFIVPRDRELGITASLEPYAEAAVQTRFQSYVEDFAYPFFAAQTPGFDFDDLLAVTDLRLVADFLRSNPNSYLIHNADDPILAPGDLAILENLFPNRATIYPDGGHCGNMTHRQVAAHILERLRP